MKKIHKYDISNMFYKGYRIINKIFFNFIEDLIRNISGYLGVSIRRKYYAKRFSKCGKNLKIDEGVYINGLNNLHVGDNVWIDKNCIINAGNVKIKKDILKYKKNKCYIYKEGDLHIGSNVHIAAQCIIQAHGGVSIGNNCGFSAGVKIYSLINMPNKADGGIVHFTPLSQPFYLKSEVVIKDNVGIALNSSVLPGVTIEKNSFVAPYSMVISSIRENSFVSGNPARFVKKRFKFDGK